MDIEHPSTTSCRLAKEDLYQYMRRLAPGAVVTFQVLTEVAHIDERSPRVHIDFMGIQDPRYRPWLDSVITRLREEDRRVFINIRGEGYRLATDPECVAEGSECLRRIRAEAHRGLSKPLCAVPGALDTHHRQMYHSTIGRIGALRVLAAHEDESSRKIPELAP